MKNRKTVVVAFLLVAVMLLGVGYAAVTNVLDIQGSISISADAVEKEFNEDIYFTGVVYGDEVVNSVGTGENAGYTANINANNNDKAQFTVTTAIANKNDATEITYQIKNDSEHDATVTLKTITNTNGTTQGTTGDGDFDFDFYFGSQGTREAEIAAGSTVNVTVTVKLLKQLAAASTASFVIELNVSAG